MTTEYTTLQNQYAVLVNEINHFPKCKCGSRIHTCKNGEHKTEVVTKANGLAVQLNEIIRIQLQNS
jgi:hypothetical protein